MYLTGTIHPAQQQPPLAQSAVRMSTNRPMRAATPTRRPTMLIRLHHIQDIADKMARCPRIVS
jgi:hypothetical protein